MREIWPQQFKDGAGILAFIDSPLYYTAQFQRLDIQSDGQTTFYFGEDFGEQITRIFVNGAVYYEGYAFTLNRETRTLTWSGEFPLETTDKAYFCYFCNETEDSDLHMVTESGDQLYVEVNGQMMPIIFVR